MKLSLSEQASLGRPICWGRLRRKLAGNRRNESGSAILIVIILLAVLTTLAVSNSLALRHLKREMKLIERKQIERLTPPRGAPPAERANLAPQPKE